MPTTLEAMADVYGIGEYKAEAYGKPFIEAIKQYIDDSADLPFLDAVPISTTIRQPSYMERQKQLHTSAYARRDEENDKKLIEYYKQGLSISEIASLMKRNTGGISSRIKKLGLREQANNIDMSEIDSTYNIDRVDEYMKELKKLTEMRAVIDKKIEELRMKMNEK